MRRVGIKQWQNHANKRNTAIHNILQVDIVIEFYRVVLTLFGIQLPFQVYIFISCQLVFSLCFFFFFTSDNDL